MKKWLKAALCVLLAILLIVGGYVAYVFIDYHRIGDMALTPSDGGAAAVRTDTPYTVLSYNIGFGAYEDDYGFFMDGGTESRAWSEERLTKNLSEISAFLTEQSPDFLLAQEVDIRANCYVGKITEEQITRLVRTLKGLTFPITDYAPFEYAVVTAGGVRCDEVNPYTMESLKVKGLYFAGEVLDIDANTGGYNLQIAFSTGRLAGSLKK